MMNLIYRITAIAGLILVLLPSIFYYLGSTEAGQMNKFIFLGTVLWFAGAIPWLGRKKKEA